MRVEISPTRAKFKNQLSPRYITTFFGSISYASVEFWHIKCSGTPALPTHYVALRRRVLMTPHSLDHVSVWLEDELSDEKGFRQALEWASWLNLPLHAVVTSRRLHSRSTNQPGPMIPYEKLEQSHRPVVEKMKALGIACSQRGISLEMFMWLGEGDMGIEQFLRPHGLCVCVDDASSRAQEELLRRSSGCHENAVLLCAPTCGSINRILVLYDQSVLNAAYLESVARFCQALEMNPIILVVAKTAREAHLRQGYAEGVCNSFRLRADFDHVIGCDIRSAVTRVASWRSCSHLIVERRLATSWWQRSSVTGLERFRGFSDSLSLLALPEAIVLDVPQRIRNDGVRLLGKPASMQPKKFFQQ